MPSLRKRFDWVRRRWASGNDRRRRAAGGRLHIHRVPRPQRDAPRPGGHQITRPGGDPGHGIPAGQRGPGHAPVTDRLDRSRRVGRDLVRLPGLTRHPLLPARAPPSPPVIPAGEGGGGKGVSTSPQRSGPGGSYRATWQQESPVGRRASGTRQTPVRSGERRGRPVPRRLGSATDITERQMVMPSPPVMPSLPGDSSHATAPCGPTPPGGTR